MLKIGRYQIQHEIGRGGMATVYSALDPHFNRQVAIKVLPRQFTHDPKFLTLFEQEAKTIAALEHPAIVPVYDFGEEDDAPFMVMRYMAGGSLHEEFGEQPFPLDRTAYILSALAPALDMAHKQGIIHRDIKPANVLFDAFDSPYLADFGISRMVEATHTMTIVGTPAYMSPEQVRGKIKLDGRSDVYALGVMLFELLTGQRPYEADTPSGKMVMHLMDPIPEVHLLNPGLPEGTQDVIDRAMAKDREERYQSAAELAEAVEAIVSKPAIPAADPGQNNQKAAAETIIDTSPDLQLENSSDSLKTRRIPSWPWWLGAILLLAVMIFGFRSFVGSGVQTAEPTLQVDGIVVIASSATSTPTMEPSTVMPTASATGTLVPTSASTQSPAITPTPAFTRDPSWPAVLELGDTWVRSTDGMTMVYVPAGTFPMGRDDGPGKEFPAHEVMLDGYWIDRTEVTNSQYEKCLRDGNCEPSYFEGNIDFGGAEYPVVGISWFDAVAYCSWVGGVLPTEAQWEYAARGPEGYLYPWGNVFDGERTNFCDITCAAENHDEVINDGYGRAAPVGSYPTGASWVGALDMSGNVWEWVNDWYDDKYYERSPGANPPGPDSGILKAIRSGAWMHSRYFIRGSDRFSIHPIARFDHIGIRCVIPDP